MDMAFLVKHGIPGEIRNLQSVKKLHHQINNETLQWAENLCKLQ